MNFSLLLTNFSSTYLFNLFLLISCSVSRPPEKCIKMGLEWVWKWSIDLKLVIFERVMARGFFGERLKLDSVFTMNTFYSRRCFFAVTDFCLLSDFGFILCCCQSLNMCQLNWIAKEQSTEACLFLFFYFKIFSFNLSSGPSFSNLVTYPQSSEKN